MQKEGLQQMLQTNLQTQVPRQRAEIEEDESVIRPAVLYSINSGLNCVFAALAFAFYRSVWLQAFHVIGFFVFGGMAYKFWCKVRRR